MKQAMDKETSQVLQQGQAILDLVKSPGWQDVKNKLVEKIMTLGDITMVETEGKSAEQVMMDFKVRKQVIDVLVGWVKEVEGDANQFISNQQMLQEIKKTSVYIQL